jgi:hypothetical protein
MDAEEVEILEGILTKYFEKSKFLDLMRHKCGNEKLNSLSFKNFIYETTAFHKYDKESDEIKTTFFSLANTFSKMMFNKSFAP